MSIVAVAAFAAFFGYVLWSTVPYTILMIRLTSSLERPDCTWANLSSLAELTSQQPNTLGSISYIRGQGKAAGLRTNTGRRVFLANDDCTVMIAVVDAHRIRMDFYDRTNIELEAIRHGRLSSLLCSAIGFELRAPTNAVGKAVRRLLDSNFNVAERR